MKQALELTLIKVLLPCLLCCNVAFAAEAGDTRYTVNYSATFKPERGVVEARIEVIQPERRLRLLDMKAPETEFTGFAADGAIERAGNRLLWTVPVTGGTLAYQVRVDHERDGLLDAQMTKEWAIVRLDDIFPPARVRSRIGASSQSLLELHGPPGWRFESRYRVADGAITIDEPDRGFDRPTGWLVAGTLGIRREIVAQRRVSIAAPEGQGMRRMDIAAFMRWTLPKLVRVFPQFPDRLLIVGARDDMWRGGLSGPGSIYLHTERPLISENATSSLLHELVHTATTTAGTPKEDWITEGLAEYYSLEILRRSRGISNRRFQQSLQELSAWANKENGKLKSPSSGANTARAVLVFDLIQRELAEHDAGSLDTVVQKLLAADTIDGGQLLQLVESALGSRSKALRDALHSNPD
jgi:hypothetical protein